MLETILSTENQNSQNKFPRYSVIIQGIFFLSFLLLIYLAFDAIETRRNQQQEKVLQHMSVIVDLVSDNIVGNVEQVKNSLRLLSRMPAFRTSRVFGMSRSTVQKFEEFYGACLDHVDDSLKTFLPTFFSRVEDVLTETYSAQSVIGSAPELLFLQSKNVPYFVSLVRDFLSCYKKGTFNILELSSDFFDLIFHTGVVFVSDFFGAEDALKASLNDKDYICSLMIRSLDGTKRLLVTEIGQLPSFLSAGIRISETFFQPFYSGKVFFSEGLSRPLWQAAVPLLELDRKPFGILSSQVDLSFLSELSGKIKFSSGSQLFVIDEEGTVIGHSKKQLVINQVNFSRFNPAFSEVMQGRDGMRRIGVNGVDHLLVYRSLKNLGKPDLPIWGVLFTIPISEVFTGDTAVSFGIFSLAGLCILILWYLSDFILSNLEEEEA
ncbi:hypothetical protein HYY75_12130 [bacterium]|nr:hypothetical protein [bacterium]